MGEHNYYPSGRNCPECGAEIMLFDISYIGAIGREATCPCVLEKDAATRKAMIEHGIVLARDEMRKRSGMGMRYQGHSFESFRVNDNNQAAFTAAEQFTAAYLKDGQTPGLLLCGNAGSGKTFLACAIANRIIDSAFVSDGTAETLAKGWHKDIYPPLRFYGTADLLQRIRASYNSGQGEEESNDLTDVCKKTKLLLLDDFGAEKITDWVLEQFYSIIEYRYQNCLHMIVTSNETPGGIKKKFGERIADRIRTCCHVVPLNGDSQRRTA
jgi:DNA replication protein DnaC